MPSKTSFFNKTIFKKNLSRFMPLWAAYTLIWIFTLTLPVFTDLRHWTSIGSPDYLPQFTYQMLETARTGGIIMGFLFGPMTAMAMWGYMNTAKSVGMYASLPIKREGLFITTYVSGIVGLLVGNCVAFLLTFIVELMYGFVQIVPLLHWLALTSISGVFFYSFATLISMMTGHMAAMPVLYAILNFTAVLIEALVRHVIAPIFIYGFGGYDNGLIFMRLSPAVYMIENTRVSATFSEPTMMGSSITGYYFSGWGVMLGYFAAGIVLAVIALLMYRRRAMESAGDVIAVRRLRPVFKYVFSMGCAFTLGALIHSILYVYYNRYNSSSAIAICVCMLLGGVLGYYIAEMLLKKSFRVWREGLRGAIAVVAAVILFSLTLELDLLGIERKVPSSESVKSVSVMTYGSNHHNIMFFDSSNIDEVLSIHGSAIEKKSEYEAYNGNGVNLNIYYYADDNAQGRAMIYRTYYIPYEGSDYYDNPDSDFRALSALINTEEAQEYRNRVPVPVNEDSITACWIHYWDPEICGYTEIDLGSVNGAKLYNDCIVPDRETSMLGYAWLIRETPAYYETVYAANITFEIMEKTYDDFGREQRLWHQITVNPTIDATLTMDWIRERGIELTLEKDMGLYADIYDKPSAYYG